MNFESLVIGVVLGAIVAFGTGFLRKAGEDLYSMIRNKINPNFQGSSNPQVVVHLHGNETLSNDKFNPISTEIYSRISIDDIEKAIERVPPLQRDDVLENFKGLKIEWSTYLRSASKAPDGNISLRLSLDVPYRGRAVLCEVPEADYLELKVLPENAPIRISGEIIEAWPDVKLANAQLQIVKNEIYT